MEQVRTDGRSRRFPIKWTAAVAGALVVLAVVVVALIQDASGSGPLSVLGGGIRSAISFVLRTTAGFALLAIAAAIYLVPTYIALRRKHHQLGMIAVVNVFLGWTFLGWVIALAIAMSALRPKAQP